MANKQTIFSVNINHPLYQQYICQYERYGFGESVDLDIRTLFYLLPDEVNGHSLSAREKEGLLVDQFVYLDDFSCLIFQPFTGQFSIQYSPLLESDRQKQTMLLTIEDCLFTIPCPHPFFLNTYDPLFMDWITRRLDTGIAGKVSDELLRLIPDIVQGTLLSNEKKAELFQTGTTLLENGNSLHFDPGSQSLLLQKEKYREADRNIAESSRQLMRHECRFHYEQAGDLLLTPDISNTSFKRSYQQFDKGI